MSLPSPWSIHGIHGIAACRGDPRMTTGSDALFRHIDNGELTVPGSLKLSLTPTLAPTLKLTLKPFYVEHEHERLALLQRLTFARCPLIRGIQARLTGAQDLHLEDSTCPSQLPVNVRVRPFVHSEFNDAHCFHGSPWQCHDSAVEAHGTPWHAVTQYGIPYGDCHAAP